MAHDVFISHSSKDKVVADATCAALERAGIRCWVAPRDILPGANWATSILKAISDSRMMVLIFSEHTQDSQHIRREVERAVHHGIPIAPIRIQQVMPADDLEYYLSSSHWMDAMTGPFERHLEEMSRKVTVLLDDESTSRRKQVGGASSEPPLDAAGGAVKKAGSEAPRTQSTGRGRGRWTIAVLSLAAVVLIGVVLWYVAMHVSGRSPSSGATAQSAGPGAVTAARGNTDAAHPHGISAGNSGLSPVVNSLGMAFKAVEPGSFLMGSPTSEAGRAGDETQHRVRITRGFQMGVHHVTRAQFAAFVQASGYRTEAEKDGFGYAIKDAKFIRQDGASWRDAGFPQGDDHPVVNVSWNDSVAFAEWLSKKEGKSYRLPTEAEYEYACRAGTTTAYPWGDDPNDGKGCTNAADLTAGKQFPTWATFGWEDGYVYTSPVGAFKPNAWGLYDMIGNALEWCSDWYEPYPAGDAVDPTGPVNPTSADKAYRALRGGSWSLNPPSCRAASRYGYTPDFRNYMIGFRLCLDL